MEFDGAHDVEEDEKDKKMIQVTESKTDTTPPGVDKILSTAKTLTAVRETYLGKKILLAYRQGRSLIHIRIVLLKYRRFLIRTDRLWAKMKIKMIRLWAKSRLRAK